MAPWVKTDVKPDGLRLTPTPSEWKGRTEARRLSSDLYMLVLHTCLYMHTEEVIAAHAHGRSDCKFKKNEEANAG